MSGGGPGSRTGNYMEFVLDQLLLRISSQRHFLIALGSNLPVGDSPPVDVLKNALSELERRGVTIENVSGFFQTPCFPAGDGPDYVNAAASILAKFYPQDLLTTIHEIEADFGRERDKRWASRGLDIDILASGSEVLPDSDSFNNWMSMPANLQPRVEPDQLILPHPRLHERSFVLVPLAEVAPHWTHPVLGKTVTEMLDERPETERAEIIPLE